MREQEAEVARLAVAWGRPMSEIREMTGHELAAMDSAYRELWRRQRRAR